MFKITETAVKKVLEAATQSNAEGMGLRVAAKSNQDGSIEYGIGFDEAQDSDLRISQGSVEILIDPPSQELLEETTMDYVEFEPGQFRFIFMNPLDPHYVPPKKGTKSDAEK